MRSLLRRIIVWGRSEPFDVEVFPSVRARLYPTTNICEKRVIAAPQLYDWPERRALSEAMEASTSEPFVFLDLGANVGVYSLWIIAEARRLGRNWKVVAVEPDPETQVRLETNLAMSDAEDVIIERCAVGSARTVGHVVQHSDNRGQHHIVAEDEGEGYTVEVVPLQEICARNRIDRIDAMKVDLEGYDYPVLDTFFANTPAALWPNLIVVEAGKAPNPPVVALCVNNGYRLQERTKLNAVLRRQTTH